MARINLNGYALSGNGPLSDLERTAETAAQQAYMKSGISRAFALRAAKNIVDVVTLSASIKNLSAREGILNRETSEFFLQNMLRPKENLASGNALTLCSDTLVDEYKYLTDRNLGPLSKDAEKRIRKIEEHIKNLDFNDSDSVEGLKALLRQYMSDQDVEMLDLKSLSEVSPEHICIYLAMRDEAHVEELVEKIETQIRQIVPIEDLKAEGLHKHLLGKIATGQLDLEAVINSGEFCGQVITPELEAALLSLKVIAEAENISRQGVLDTLESIGVNIDRLPFEGDDEFGFDLNNIKDVAQIVGIIERRLDNIAPLPDGRTYKKLSIKELNEIDTSEFSEKAKEAISALIKMKNHQATLAFSKRLGSEVAHKGLFVWRKITKDNSEFTSGIQRLMQTKRMAAISLRVARTLGRFAYKLCSPLLDLAKAGGGKILNTKFVSGFTEPLKATVGQFTTAVSNAAHETFKVVSDAVGNVTTVVKDAAKGVVKKVGKTKVGRAFNRISKPFKRWHKNRLARKAESKILKLFGTLKKFHTKLTAFKKWIFKIALIIIAVYVITTFVGCMFQLIAGPMAVIDEAVAKVAEFFERAWYGETLEEGKTNILYGTVKCLLSEEERYSTASEILEDYRQDGWLYYSFIEPGRDFVDFLEYPSANLIDTPLRTTYFTYKDTGLNLNIENEPTNQFSTIKLACSMAHAFTFPIETHKDLEIYTTYAIGVWHHINDVSLVLYGEITPDSVKYYNYSCAADSNGEYDHVYAYKRHIARVGDKIPYVQLKDGPLAVYIPNGYEDIFSIVLVNRDLVPKTASGCEKKVFDWKTGSRYIIYNNSTGLIKRYESATGKTLSSAVNNGSLLSKVYAGEKTVDEVFYTTVIGATTLRYCLNPVVSDECLNNELKALLSTNNEQAVKDAFEGISVCVSPDSCTNSSVEYCDGCEGEWVYGNEYTFDLSDGTSLYNSGISPCMCHQNEASGLIIHHLYTCGGGHITYHGSLEGVGLDGEYYEHCSKTKRCDDAKKITIRLNGASVQVVYCCPGHSSKCTNLLMRTPCAYANPATIYECPGVDNTYCNGHKICLGHYKVCSGHNYCPGHTCEYSLGEMRCEVTTIIHTEDNEEFLFSDWAYNKTDKFLWMETIKPVTSVSLLKDMNDAKKDKFKGWGVQENRDMVWLSYTLDWYEQYGISSSSFDGAKLEKSEIASIMETFGIKPSKVPENRCKVVETALQYVGKIPFYPSDIGYAKSPELDENGFGERAPLAINYNGRVYESFGLTNWALPDLVFWKASETEENEYTRNMKLFPLKVIFGDDIQEDLPVFLDRSNIRNYSEVTTNNLKPGDVIISAGSANEYTGKCGIFVGYSYEDTTDTYYMYVVTMSDDSEWCSYERWKMYPKIGWFKKVSGLY